MDASAMLVDGAAGKSSPDRSCSYARETCGSTYPEVYFPYSWPILAVTSPMKFALVYHITALLPITLPNDVNSILSLLAGAEPS
jgi:hypothetical protein